MENLPIRRRLSKDDQEYLKYILGELRRWQSGFDQRLIENEFLEEYFSNPYGNRRRLEDLLKLLETTLAKYLPRE